LLQHVKVQLSSQTCKCDFFAHFFVAVTVELQEFVISELGFTIEAGQQMTAPVEACKLVPVTHYDVSITSLLAKNI